MPRGCTLADDPRRREVWMEDVLDITPETKPTPRPAPMPEPATARALWPTFMRRTLAEDSLRTPAEPAART